MFRRDARSRVSEVYYIKSLLLKILYVIFKALWISNDDFGGNKLRRKSFVNYPITTSSTIISTNPTAKPMVLRLLCGSDEDSGISSSTTT